ncbi:hypothetical protein D3C72_2311830 [compost metagenome]
MHLGVQLQHSGFEHLGGAEEGQHGAVVVRVGGVVEPLHAGHALDGFDDGSDHFGAASLTDVGDALDQLSHLGILYNVKLR